MKRVNTDINERIKRIADEVFNGNITQMAKVTYISRTTIYSIIGDKPSMPGYDVIRKIVEMPTPEINLDWLITGDGEMLEAKQRKMDEETRPRLPMTVAAGSLAGFSQGTCLDDCVQVPVIRSLPSYDFTMIVKGDSMEPKYEGGDEIAISKVNDFIEWGRCYVLDTRDGAILKRLYDAGDKYRCASYNSEYPDFFVSKADVFGVYKVVGLIRI